MRRRLPFAGLAELADAMDSKSIARKGVPVRLRDPVLNPDETFVSSGFFLLVFRRLCEEREATLASGAFGTALILAVETIATCLRRLRFGRAAKKKGGTARNSLLSLTRGCYFRKNRL